MRTLLALAMLLLTAAPALAQVVDFGYRSGGLGILRPRVDVRVQSGFPYGAYPYYGGFGYYPYPTFAAPAPYFGGYPWGAYPYPGGFGGGCVYVPGVGWVCR